MALGLEKMTITVLDEEGKPLFVDALVSGEFAIHRSIDRFNVKAKRLKGGDSPFITADHTSVTFVRGGRILGMFKTFGQAKEFMFELWKIEEEFEVLEPPYTKKPLSLWRKVDILRRDYMPYSYYQLLYAL